MNTALLRERVRYFRSRGGPTATCWWLAKKGLGIEAHHLLRFDLRAPPISAPGTGCFTFLVVAAGDKVRELPSGVMDQVDEHTGRGISRLIAEGQTVYVLLDGLNVVCQLNIGRGGRVVLDSPPGLCLECRTTDAFLSYLYTHEGYRRVGAASRLLPLVCRDLAEKGFQRVFAHVSTTNVPSLNTFRRTGWQRVGTFFTTSRGRLLYAGGLERMGAALSSRLARTKGPA